MATAIPPAPAGAAEFPRKLRFLFEPHRYKVPKGGSRNEAWNSTGCEMLANANFC